MWGVTEFGSKCLLHIVTNSKKGEYYCLWKHGFCGHWTKQTESQRERQIMCSKYHFYVESEKEKQVKLIETKRINVVAKNCGGGEMYRGW